MLSHRVNVLRSHPGALLEPRGAMVCPYPLFHMGAWTIALQQWQARDRVVLVSAADAGSIVTAVERHQATRLNCIPAVWRRLLERLGPGGLPSVRFADTGTSATPPELLEAIAAALPQAQIRIFYGSTEAGSVAMLEHADVRRKPGTCGVPGPSVSVRTSPDGELWVRSPVLFDGYFDDPGATAEALVDGWYRTGDLVDVDGDGYLTVTGRARDVLRTGGETVAPAEVEAVLAGHPAVADVAVVGLPDADWGEVVCAVVVADRPGASLEDLRAHCVGRLASFKHPRRLAVMDAIPRTAATEPGPAPPVGRASDCGSGKHRSIIPRAVFWTTGAGWSDELLITGIGGQGVQLAAQVIASAVIAEGREVQLFGSYGGMMRGGNTEATLVVADGPIEAPPTIVTDVVGHRHAPRVRGTGPPARLRPGRRRVRQLHRCAASVEADGVDGRRAFRRPTSPSSSATS